ncbi:MAG TPA: MG2 domain-containing protein, partial [Thermoanaerobaculia bacterium]|nr:MG2 domain-containing protein [Thermoanaerobaculia bacterium]
MKRFAVVLFLLFSSALHAAPTLRIVSAGPVGEVASAAEASEIRVVFSEPMVVVGRIPQPVRAPWLRIAPAAAGTFRWSGTTTLIFTPNPRLPFARKYDVTIDSTATSVAGNTLDRSYSFSFTTPTVRLLNTNWYRGTNGTVVIGLRFNQPVDPETIAQHVQLRTAAHPFVAPILPDGDVAAFEKKKSRAAAAAASNGQAVFAFRAREWDTNRLGVASPDLVVFETKPGVPPDTHLQVLIDDQLAMRRENVRTGREQEFRIQLEPTLFVEGTLCPEKCDPDQYNALRFRTNAAMMLAEVRKAVTVTDITDPANEQPLPRQEVQRDFDYPASEFSLDAIGYSLQPARRYRVRVDPSLASNDGQSLGYTWIGTIENWHRTAFISFGDGQGVWESGGGPILPFHARNFRSVRQWLAPLELERLMPTILELQRTGFRSGPPAVKPQDRTLAPVADKTQSYGLDVSSATGDDNRGLVWAAVQPGQAIARSRIHTPSTRATIVQVTNLGISVKDSPLNTLIFVTQLDSGVPVAGANVSIRTTDNKVFWSGVTDAQGLAIAPDTKLRLPKKPVPKPAPRPGMTRRETFENDEQWWRALSELHFIVVAEKDGDIAYVGSDWNEGITPWELGTNFDAAESQPLLRGTVFTDRGVYKLGEEIHFKAVLRTDTPTGMRLLPPGTKVEIALTDPQSRSVDKRTVALNMWSSVDWTFTLPAEGALGTYSVAVSMAEQRLEVRSDFLVAAYRRPDFRVDVTLDGPSTLAGVPLTGKITGRYLHGGAMADRDVTWKYDKRATSTVPSKITDRFARFSFLDDASTNWTVISTEDATLDERGERSLTLQTDVAAGIPYEYRLEGDVTDVTRQHIANRTSFRVDPAPWYIGVLTPDYFTEAEKGLETELVAVGLDGLAVAGVPIHVTLQRIQWNSVRRAVGNGFYEWDTEQQEITAGQWDVTSQSAPMPLQVPLASGGQYQLIAKASDGEGRSTTTMIWFYAVGAGYTAWERYDHNRIDLVPEKPAYRPGQTARIMIKSPWERATALLTTEREGIRTWQRFELTSTQQTVTVPITEKEIPNVFVSVLLVKGRTQEAVTEDAGDPGRPSFRLGYVELSVEDASKRLAVDVDANRDEFRPATKARIEVNVKDAAGRPSQSEVTLWAVDYGVLSLTDYRTPDVLESIYLDKALQVVNEDSRQRIVSRRVLTPKGA